MVPWEVTVGFEHSPGFQQFPGFGWTTLVIESSRQAYIPVRQMAWVFALLLAITSLLAVGFSMLIAGRIARPIAALTDFTRRFKRDRQLPPAPQATGGEVGELTDTFIQTVRDLDQSRADLIRASKLAVLGEVAAVMAHEIRTPVGILRSSAQMLARDPGLNEEARELTGFIESEADRLNRLVTTLLDSARQRLPHCQPTDLHDVIRHVAALLEAQAGKNNIAITLDLACTPSIVPLDAEQMTQVLLNLVLNALQILPPGGRITITTRSEDAHAIIEVADNGPGIPDEAIRGCSTPSSPNVGRRGLGLAVVQQIVHSHERHRAAAARWRPCLPSTLPQEPYMSQRVLVVDDEPKMQRVRKSCCNAWGTDRLREQRAEALQILKSGSADLIISDLHARHERHRTLRHCGLATTSLSSS